MSTRWTDTSAFANATEVADADLLPLSDVSATEGSRQRTLTGAVLRAQVGGASSIGAAPGVGDDSADGYRVGSLVLTPADVLYVCTDASAGAAVWVKVTDAALNKFDATVAPAAGDDTADGYAPGSLWVDVTADKAYICLDATATAAVWQALGTGTGDVVGPASAVDERIAVFDGTTGKILKDGGATVAGLATAAQGDLADSAVQPGDPVSINAQTGTTYTYVLADAGKLVTHANAGAISGTVPTNATVAYSVGTVIALQQMGAGALTVVGDTGVTINGTTPGSVALTDAQYKTTATLTKHATDTWTLTGAVS